MRGKLLLLALVVRFFIKRIILFVKTALLAIKGELLGVNGARE